MSLAEVVPMVCLGFGSTVGGYLLQAVVFDFGRVFLLEVGFKLVLGVVFVMGGVCVFLRRCVFGGGYSFRWVRGLGSYVRSLGFSGSVVRFLSQKFFEKAYLGHKIVELGWNEEFSSGRGFYGFVVKVNFWVLTFWCGSLLTRCLVTSLYVLVLGVVFRVY